MLPEAGGQYAPQATCRRKQPMILEAADHGIDRFFVGEYTVTFVKCRWAMLAVEAVFSRIQINRVQAALWAAGRLPGQFFLAVLTQGQLPVYRCSAAQAALRWQ